MNPPESRDLLPHLVEHLAVELSLLALALHLGHLDHVPQQVEGQVDGERRLLAALQLLGGPQRLLHALLLPREHVEALRVPPLQEPQDVVLQEVRRGGAVRSRVQERVLQALRVEAAAGVRGEARSAGGGAEVRGQEDGGEEQEEGDRLHVLKTKGDSRQSWTSGWS